jgi:prepilin-type N-terminal cleavage/methylation domain-containing protein
MMRTPQTKRLLEAGFSMIELMICTVVVSIVLAMVTSILATSQKTYLDQRQLLETQTNAVTALHTMVRLIRMAGSNPEDISGLNALDPDPDGNDVFDSIRIQADWNPADGALDDDYEDVIFATGSDVLTIKEPSNTNAVPFLEGINSITFSFLDSAGASIANPETSVADIAVVRISLTAQAVGNDARTFDTTAAVRSRLN